VDVTLLVFTLLGSIAATVAAILLAFKEDKKSRSWLILLAVGGLVATGICAGVQFFSAHQTETNWTTAHQNAKDLKKQLDTAMRRLKKQGQILNSASIDVDALAQLNQLSSGRFHVRLATDTDASRLCRIEHGIDNQFQSPAANQGVRVIRVGRAYQLIFGKGLSLAAAQVYQTLAINHSLGNGRPLIENETGNEIVVDCSEMSPAPISGGM
jgi:hypothetical protein